MIQLDNVSYIYKSSHEDIEDVVALKDVSITIPKGQFVAVVGSNGSGKSTFARLLNALFLPSKGSVRILGLSTLKEENIWKIRTSLGMVFQNPDNQIIATSVEEDVAFGPENLGIEPSQIRKRVEEALRAVEMWEYRKHAPHFLSGGQKQRIAIAGILAMKPKCIVLDEATAMLDPKGRKEVMRILHKLNNEEKITIVHITHHMDEAIQADRIIVMDKGKIVEDDSPVNVFSKIDMMKALALNVPQVTELIYNLKKHGFVGLKGTIYIEEAKDVLVNWIKEYKKNSIKKTVKDSNTEGLKKTSDPIIKIRNLSYIYMQGTAYEKTALKDINLDVYKREFLGIIGHTGSGKSTLVQHFNGLLKPCGGEISVNGISVRNKNIKQLRMTVGLIFQYPEHQLFEETVYKDISFGLVKMGLSDDEIEARIKSVSRIVGLDETFYNKSPFELSGGQKRRVAIAGVLVMMPKILVLDEPTAGLDPLGAYEIYEFLAVLRKEYGTTIIVISHNMEYIAKYADRIIVMNRGKIEMEGDKRNIFKNSERLEKLGLDIPEITRLFKGLHRKIPDIKDDILTVKEGTQYLLSI